jgi:hypothetical protein
VTLSIVGVGEAVVIVAENPLLAWMGAQGLVNPERMTAVLAPGFREAGR